MKTTGNKFVNTLQPHQDELIHLSELAGIHMSQQVFRLALLSLFFNVGIINVLWFIFVGF